MNVHNHLQENDIDWLERSEFWNKQTSINSKPKTRQKFERTPVILCGHGVRLSIERGTLRVQNGFTHHPQERESWRFFPGKWQHPSRIVVLDGNGSVSFDVLSWLEENETPLVQINWRGKAVHATGGMGYKLDPVLVQKQTASQSPAISLEIAQQLILSKVRNSIDTLKAMDTNHPAFSTAIIRIEETAQSLQDRPVDSLGDLFGKEGSVANAYFSAWQHLKINWKAGDQKIIPEDWRHAGHRRSRVAGITHKNRHASHPVNAMLNYAYAVLESQVRSHIVGYGLDPTIGYIHGKKRRKHTLVFDLMEPLKPTVDREILEFVRCNMFSKGDFTISRHGECRLNPQLARMVAGVVLANLRVEEHISQFEGMLPVQR